MKKRINIKPAVQIIAVILLIFCFVPIFSVMSSRGIVENVSVLKFITSFTYEIHYGGKWVSGNPCRLVGILVMISSFLGILICFIKSRAVLEAGLIVPGVYLFGAFVWGYLTFQAKGLSLASRNISPWISSGESESVFLPVVMVLLNIFNFVALILAYTEKAEFRDVFNLANGYQVVASRVMQADRHWICKECNASNNMDNLFCGHCGAKRSHDTEENKKEGIEEKSIGWVCSNCEAENKSENLFCNKCGFPRPENAKFDQRELPVNPEKSEESEEEQIEEEVQEAVFEKENVEKISTESLEEVAFCRKCGAKREVEGDYCRKCGAKLI